MNTSKSSETIDSELVAEVVRVMRVEHLIASAATTQVILRQKRFFGNASLVAKMADELFTKENSPRYRSHPPSLDARQCHT